MNRSSSFIQDQNECTVYVRFPIQNCEIDEKIVKLLFSQFGGLSKIVMKPDNNYAFVVYDKPNYALYVCELLNGINFMNGTLAVKPRDKTRNADLFSMSQWSRPSRHNRVVYYNQLNRIPFEQFNPDVFVDNE